MGKSHQGVLYFNRRKHVTPTMSGSILGGLASAISGRSTSGNLAVTVNDPNLNFAITADRLSALSLRRQSDDASPALGGIRMS